MTRIMTPIKKRLEELPTEIISKCFSHIAGSTGDIKNLRLVSRRCNDISSPFLMDFVRVFITSPSLQRLEAISRHPAFSKSIKTIEINISYYDSVLAMNLALFAQNCGSNLYRNLDSYEHWGGESMIDTGPLYQAVEEWEAVQSKGIVEVNSTERQKFLLAAYKEYYRRWKDQEEIKTDRNYLKRICEALSRFSIFGSVVISDYVHYDSGWGAFVRSEARDRGSLGIDGDKSLSRSEKMARHWFSDESLMADCLNASGWKGSFQTAYLTSPPVEIIPQLFQALENESIQLSKFKISITPPTDIRCLQLTETQQHIIKSVLQHSQKLSFEIRSWARKDSLAEDNSRPREEMLSLCSLTTVFFTSENLTRLNLSFHQYPAFYEVPQVSLANILQLAAPWPYLRELFFTHIPLRIAELQSLVNKLKGTLETCSLIGVYLLDGSWVDVLDILRRFQNLKEFDLKYGRGAELGHGRGFLKKFPKEEARDYVLRLQDRNPLWGFKWEEG